MKTILLVRHGKSDWSSDARGDFDRPLADRGLRDAPMMGRMLKNYGLTPELVLSSPAKRAAETTRLISDAVGIGSGTVKFVDAFYGCSTSAYYAEARRMDDSVETLMIVGHNPTMAEAVSSFAADGRLSVDFPTCAVACLDFHGSWSGCAPGVCSLRFFAIPKLIKKAMAEA
jgi:phosphohistidine phosphatase